MTRTNGEKSTVREVFHYYRDVALMMGLGVNEAGEVPDPRGMSVDELIERQGEYSVADFYQRNESLVRSKSFGAYHRLMAAFLGDEGALRRVRNEIERASCPYTRGELDLLFSKGARLNPSDVGQTKAVLRALSQPLTIVQGPPGTGKSQTIANIVSCVQGLKTGKTGDKPTVAIVSTNKEAVRNALEGIWKLERVCDASGHALRPLCVRLGNQKMRAKAIEDLRERGQADRLRRVGVPESYDGKPLPLRFLDEYPVFGCTLHSLYKCFDGIEAFDYVIVDEGSQVPNYLGLIALRYARHLILMGDVKQIPPVIDSRRLAGLALGQVDPRRREGGDNSFIRMCEEVFGLPIGGGGNVMLRRHYRCDPGIIGFCSQYVYADENGEPGLIPMVRRPESSEYVVSPGAERVPIRVVWYEGLYTERLGDTKNSVEPEDNEVRPKRHNMRQVSVFLREELGLVTSEHANSRSVCVLSPYRAPLEKLQELIECEGKGHVSIVEQLESEYMRACFQLAIHGAQGKAFDVVYLLTIDDGEEKYGAPWSQQQCLINVAVSRAREELCVIASSRWFSEEIVDYLQTGGSAPIYRPRDGWPHEKGDQGRYNLKKLLKYVYDNRDKATGAYGFHRVGDRSVFDDVPRVRKEGALESRGGRMRKQKEGESAGQFCMRHALEEALRCDDFFAGGSYRLCDELRVEDVLNCYGVVPADEELRRYVKKDGTRFDLVLWRGDDPIMAIEVDGEYHREDATSIANDVMKNRVVAEELGGAVYGARDVSERHMGSVGRLTWADNPQGARFALVRIPSNGETCNEVELVKRLLGEM